MEGGERLYYVWRAGTKRNKTEEVGCDFGKKNTRSKERSDVIRTRRTSSEVDVEIVAVTAYHKMSGRSDATRKKRVAFEADVGVDVRTVVVVNFRTSPYRSKRFTCPSVFPSSSLTPWLLPSRKASTKCDNTEVL